MSKLPLSYLIHYANDTSFSYFMGQMQKVVKSKLNQRPRLDAFLILVSVPKGWFTDVFTFAIAAMVGAGGWLNFIYL